MKIFKWTILAAALAAILLGALAWRQLPSRVEMAGYVPLETLVYLEINDLPAVWRAISETEAWRELASKQGIEPNYGKLGWLGQTLANFNLGSTETIVAGRAQIAVALVGIGARDQNDEALRVKPQFAVVIETKSASAERFVAENVRDFAEKQFGNLRIEKKTIDNANYTVFHATADARDLFAATSGSLAVVGNDEQAVQACLDAKNRKRKSLIESEELLKMRENTDSRTAFAFGLMTGAGVKQLSEIAAVFVAGQIAEDARALGLLAQSLPPFLQKTVTKIGWTARARSGKIEDRFLIEMPPDLTARLREPLGVGDSANAPGAEFLPPQTVSATVYNFKNPGAAWRGTILALTAKLDVLSAAVFSQTTKTLLESYGVADANEFLKETRGEIFTARLPGADKNRKVAVVAVNDADQTQKHLQQTATALDNRLILGEETAIKECLKARAENRSIVQTKRWQQFAATTDAAAFVRTFDADAETPQKFVALFKKSGANDSMLNDNSVEWAQTASETKLVRDGFERRTISAFGFVATLATSFAEN